MTYACLERKGNKVFWLWKSKIQKVYNGQKRVLLKNRKVPLNLKCKNVSAIRQLNNVYAEKYTCPPNNLAPLTLSHPLQLYLGAY